MEVIMPYFAEEVSKVFTVKEKCPNKITIK